MDYKQKICLCFCRSICIFGVGDLYRLVNRRELFANKFFSDYQPLTFKCLEEWHAAREAREVRTRRIHLNMTFYESLDVRKNHVHEGRVEVRDEEWIKNTSAASIFRIKMYTINGTLYFNSTQRAGNTTEADKLIESLRLEYLNSLNDTQKIQLSQYKAPVKSARVYGNSFHLPISAKKRKPPELNMTSLFQDLPSNSSIRSPLL